MSFTKQTLAGALFAGIGLLAIYLSIGYHIGTARQMGPGFFPAIIGGVIILLGLLMVLEGLRNPNKEIVVTLADLRALVFILGGVLAFGLLIEPAGLIAALVALIVLARFGGHEGGVLEVGLMVVVLVAIAVGIFYYGLNIPFSLGPV